MKKLSKEALIATLRDMIALVEADDSFEGRLEYHAAERHVFEVEAAYRTGNSMGQGGWRIIHDPADDNAPTPFDRITVLENALRPFATFAEQWNRMPIRRMHDTLYAIHTGTEFEADFKLSDCQRARQLLEEANHG